MLLAHPTRQTAYPIAPSPLPYGQKISGGAPVIVSEQATDTGGKTVKRYNRLSKVQFLATAFLSTCSVYVVLAQEAATAAPLTFVDTVEEPNGENIIGGAPTSPVYSGPSMSFLGVATENGTVVDMLVTATVKDETIFLDPREDSYFGDTGFMPDYSQAENGPFADLGILFEGQGINDTENGLILEFQFFDGTNELSGTFSDAIVVAALDIAIYDVDGETRDPNTGRGSTQSEFFRVDKSDGLVSYSLGTGPQALSVTDEGQLVRFDGPGQNFSETDASGAARLQYENTDSFTLDFGSVMGAGGDPNPVFFAIDGDLSLFSEDDFGDPTAVPLPSGFPLIVAGLIPMYLLRRRQNVRVTAPCTQEKGGTL